MSHWEGIVVNVTLIFRDEAKSPEMASLWQRRRSSSSDRDRGRGGNTAEIQHWYFVRFDAFWHVQDSLFSSHSMTV